MIITNRFRDNYFRWGRKKVANKSHNSIEISVSGIQMDLRDVSYYVKRKQGFPSITDLGVADIFLGGSGLSFKMKLSTAEKSDRQNFFKVDKVNVSSPYSPSGKSEHLTNLEISRLTSRTSTLSSHSPSISSCLLLQSQSS
jgi:hypothetical protein